MSKLKLGFVGLGIMGAPMAGHLVAAGHEVFINTRSKIPEELANSAAIPCSSPAEVASKADIPLTTAQQQALLGRYASDELKLQILLSADGAGLQVQLEGQPALDLKAATERSLYLTVVDASLEFAPETGPVQHVTLTQGPARIVLARQ